jgi:hypothetical protein
MKILHSVFEPDAPNHILIFKEHMVPMKANEMAHSRTVPDRI